MAPSVSAPERFDAAVEIEKAQSRRAVRAEKGRSRCLKPLGRRADVAVDGFQPRETETSARVARLGKKASTRTSVRTCNNAVFAHILCRCACVVIKVIIS